MCEHFHRKHAVSNWRPGGEFVHCTQCRESVTNGNKIQRLLPFVCKLELCTQVRSYVHMQRESAYGCGLGGPSCPCLVVGAPGMPQRCYYLF